MEHREVELPDELRQLKQYHGHLGPFAVAGYIAGQIALARLKARKHFGLRARVECEPTTPQSCIVDGVQVGAGCTYGKRNIELCPSSDIAIHFENTETAEGCTLRLRPEMADRFKEWLAEVGDEEAAVRAFRIGEGLFLP